jgi:NAD(P)-dependent dehydrogenase (short-subunit alcohol dehydrogenase family)
MAIDLAGQKVLVVGAAGGIGSATARLFAAAGAHITAAGRLGAGLTAVADEVRTAPLALDFLDNHAVEAFFATHGSFDHVVIAAATTKTGSIKSLDLDDAKAAMESKFWGAYRVARAVNIRDGGSLTFVSGYLSGRPSGAGVLQGAINAAVESLARGLALEMAPVRVNTVSPGLIDTKLHAAKPEAERKAMFAAVAAHLPVRRVGQGEDVAQAILFLATNPFATGTTITVDGGATIA